MVKEISVEEVSKQKYDERRKSSSCWVIIHNDVYDVTKFLSEHPGGAEALTDYAGKDATQAFEDVGHSEDARELLKKFKIGYLPAVQRNTFIDPCCKVRVSERDSCPGFSKTRRIDGSGSFRSFDGSSPRSVTPKSSYGHHQGKPEPRVQTIVVPRESGGYFRYEVDCNEPDPGANSWSKWWLAAAALLVLGGILLAKKNMA